MAGPDRGSELVSQGAACPKQQLRRIDQSAVVAAAPIMALGSRASPRPHQRRHSKEPGVGRWRSGENTA